MNDKQLSDLIFVKQDIAETYNSPMPQIRPSNTETLIIQTIMKMQKHRSALREKI